jgi:hypothetical protein
MKFIEELLAIARRYRDELAMMASRPDDLEAVREVEKTIAAAEAANGILPGNEDSSEPNRIGMGADPCQGSSGRGAEGSGGHGDGAV